MSTGNDAGRTDPSVEDCVRATATAFGLDPDKAVAHLPNEKDAPMTPAGGHPTSDHSVRRVARRGEAATAPPAGQYDETQAWQDNYDGMFARWAECDRERLEWKRRALDAETLVRLQREELATRPTPPGEPYLCEPCRNGQHWRCSEPGTCQCTEPVDRPIPPTERGGNA